MQVRLTVEDGGVAGPGGHDEDVDELMRMLMLLLMLMLMLMLRLMVMLLAQMVMMLHLQCPVVKMFPKHIKGDHPKYAKMASCCERYW